MKAPIKSGGFIMITENRGFNKVKNKSLGLLRLSQL